LASLELPPTVPAYASLRVDDESNVWLGEYRIDPADPQRFLVFDSDGRFITVVAMSADLRVMTIAHGQVWGRRDDDLGVEYVVGYAIVE
jgi:hypothetical protein